jgi:hypothetical protein
MGTKVTRNPSQQVLTRILDAFAQELIEASDEEILEAAKDLGMDPNMKGSAAFLGVIHTAPRQLSEIFDLDELKTLLLMSDRNRVAREPPAKAKSPARRSARRRLPNERKPSNGK